MVEFDSVVSTQTDVEYPKCASKPSPDFVSKVEGRKRPLKDEWIGPAIPTTARISPTKEVWR